MGDPMNQLENPDSPTVLLRRLHRWRMAFFGLVILLAGMLSGAAVTLLAVGPLRHAQRPPAVPPVTVLMEEVIPRLHLSPEQARQVEPIVRKHYQRLHAIQQKGRTEIEGELKLMNEEMFGVLNEEQAHLWAQLLQSLPAQIRHVPEWYGPGGGRGPGPRRRMGPPGVMREPAPHVPAGPPPEANTVPHQ
jgi:hypothetical protein